MDRVIVFLSLVLAGGLLAMAACVQGVERPGAATPALPATPTLTPTLGGAPVATVVTTAAPAPTRTPTSAATETATPDLRPTATPTTTPSPSPAPTTVVPPTATSIPTPTLVPTPTAAPTTPPTPVPTPTAAPTTTPTPSPTPVPQLILDVEGPAEGTTVRGKVVVVHGVTSPGASLRINNKAVIVAEDGGFKAEVTLTAGANLIEVAATGAEGQRERRFLTVNSLALPPLPFLLLITEPQDQSIVSKRSVRVAGRTGPEAVVSVNGVSVSVDLLGIFTTLVTLDPGPNIIDVVATNTDGRVLSTVIAVIFRP